MLGSGHLSALLAFGVAALTTLGSADVRAQEPVREFADESERPPSIARTDVLLIGTGVSVGFYGAALGASYLWADDPGAEDLRIPVVGPWMKVGQTKLCDDIPDSDAGCNDVLQVFGAVLAGFSGLGQVAGLALLTEGIFMKTGPQRAGGSSVGGYTTPYRSHTAVDHAPLSFKLGKAQVTPFPIGGQSRVGLGFRGVF